VILFACQIVPCPHTGIVRKIDDTVAGSVGLLSDRHHMNPKWTAEIEPARAQAAAEPALGGLGRTWELTDESIIARAGFVPVDIVELERGSGFACRGIGEAEISRRSDRGCGCRER